METSLQRRNGLIRHVKQATLTPAQCTENTIVLSLDISFISQFARANLVSAVQHDYVRDVSKLRN